MRNFSISPIEMFSSLWRNRELVLALTRREVIGRYRGSFLGIFWSFFHPIFMLAVYTFVFSVVFKMRWNTGSESKTEFALVLFAGLIVFNFFSECINRAPTLILSNVNYVKKVVFPLEILPWATMATALFHTLISLSVWLLFYIACVGMPHAASLLLPLVFIPVLLLVMGLSWALAAFGVYLRDVSQLVGIFTTILLFLSPIFYPLSVIPDHYQPLLLLNPLAPAIEQARGVLMWGLQPDWRLYCIYLFATSLFSWFGFVCFQKTRRGFADVI